MLNLDSFDLDFDDDFSSNIFNKFSNNETKKDSKSINELNTNNTPRNSLDTVSILPFEKNYEKLKNNSLPNSPFNVSSSVGIGEKTVKLKRPHEQDEKPRKKKLIHEGLVQRKFPGPAGLLPDTPFKEVDGFTFAEKKSENIEISERDKDETVLFSQASGSVFSESAYQKLVSDFDLNEPHNPLTKYTVEWLKKSAINKSLNGRKIPFLAVTLHCINNSSPDPVLVLRDASGEINGTLHREVWINLGEKLRTGIALALRQVGVLMSGIIRRKIYLNITMNNILSIYSHTENENEVEIYPVNTTTKADLLKSVEKWHTQLANSSPAPSLNNQKNSLFCSITSELPGKSNYCKKQIRNFENKSKTLETNVVKKQNISKNEKNNVHDKVLADLGVIISDSDFKDDINIPQIDFGSDLLKSENTSRQKKERSGGGKEYSENKALSQADSLIVEEVLSGIDLDDFEL